MVYVCVCVRVCVCICVCVAYVCVPCAIQYREIMLADATNLQAEAHADDASNTR